MGLWVHYLKIFRMRIGIISEGHADRAVITNILIGITGIDSSDIEPLRPTDKFDQTDKSSKNKLSFGGWNAVQEECETRQLIDEFLSIEGQDFVVIHLDTAEADQYNIKRPVKSESYSITLRNLVIDQINLWLKSDISETILYAIAIEEIDAWILPIYEAKDSSTSAKPKEKLGIVLAKKKISSESNYDNFLSLSKNLSKEKEIKKGNYLRYNASLNAFFEEVIAKVIPKLN